MDTIKPYKAIKKMLKVSLYPYEARVLQCLYNKPYFIKALNHDAKLNHSPNAVKRLRDKGINIISEFKENPENTPTHRRRQLVEYTLHPESRELAQASLFYNRHGKL